jgi:hypothetical protein
LQPRIRPHRGSHHRCRRERGSPTLRVAKAGPRGRHSDRPVHRDAARFGSLAKAPLVNEHDPEIRTERQGGGKVNRIEGSQFRRVEAPGAIEQGLVDADQMHRPEQAQCLRYDCTVPGAPQAAQRLGSQQCRGHKLRPSGQCAPQGLGARLSHDQLHECRRIEVGSPPDHCRRLLLAGPQLRQGGRGRDAAGGLCRQAHLVQEVDQGSLRLSGPALDHQLLERAWSQRNDAGDGMAVLGHHDGFTGHHPLEDGTCLLPQLPYAHRDTHGQSLGPVSIQKLVGERIPINPATSFVIAPLRTLPPTPPLTAALDRYASASHATRTAWENAYNKPLAKLPLSADLPALSSPTMGPTPTLMASLLAMTRSGALDAALASHAGFYNSDYTNSLLFLGDSATAQENSYWSQIVSAEHLQGSQWGVMNETGSWPGQPWLWLYTMWYQVPPMNSSGNADVLVLAIMAVLSAALLAVPFIPGLRSIPRVVPVHRVIWRRYYHDHGR